MNRDLAGQLYAFYHERYKPPQWSLEETEHLDQTTVYIMENYDKEAFLQCLYYRELVNITMEKQYQHPFDSGYTKYYNATRKLAPNFSIYARARMCRHADITRFLSKEDQVFLQRKDSLDVHVINVIGFAFDDERQPDYRYFQPFDESKMEELKTLLKNIFRMIFACAKQFGVQTIWLSNFGGFAFAEHFKNAENKHIGRAAYLQFYLQCFDEVRVGETFTIHVLGVKHDEFFSEMKNRFPDCQMNKIPEALNDTDLFVNAWDPHSMVGNGNVGDDSLDGYFGRHSDLWWRCHPSLNMAMKNTKVVQYPLAKAATEKKQLLNIGYQTVQSNEQDDVTHHEDLSLESVSLICNDMGRFDTVVISCDDEKLRGVNYETISILLNDQGDLFFYISGSLAYIPSSDTGRLLDYFERHPDNNSYQKRRVRVLVVNHYGSDMNSRLTEEEAQQCQNFAASFEEKPDKIYSSPFLAAAHSALVLKKALVDRFVSDVPAQYDDAMSESTDPTQYRKQTIEEVIAEHEDLRELGNFEISETQLPVKENGDESVTRFYQSLDRLRDVAFHKNYKFIVIFSHANAVNVARKMLGDQETSVAPGEWVDFVMFLENNCRDILAASDPAPTFGKNFHVEPINIVSSYSNGKAWIVDSAGIQFINDTSGAGGSSRAIYDAFGIKKIGITSDVDVKEGGVFHVFYKTEHIIHAFSIDFRNGTWNKESVIGELSTIYKHVFTLFVGIMTQHNTTEELWLVALSAGIFAGKFADLMPEITFTAISNAMTLVPAIREYKVRLRTTVPIYEYFRARDTSLPSLEKSQIDTTGLVHERYWNTIKPSES